MKNLLKTLFILSILLIPSSISNAKHIECTHTYCAPDCCIGYAITQYNVVKEIEINDRYNVKSYESIWRKFKSYSNQKKIQDIAFTDEKGFRYIIDSNNDKRYCVAYGSAISNVCGVYVDLLLENGTIIKTVMGDQKADIHTDASNIFSFNKCCAEFIVDMPVFKNFKGSHGSCSKILEELNSPVKKYIIYEEGCL